MKSVTVAFIGGGNMACSLIGGLLHTGYQPNKVWVSDPHEEKLAKLATQYKIHTTQHNSEALTQADVVVFAVKPQNMRQAVTAAATIIRAKKPLIISIAAGITVSAIQSWLDFELPIIRCMPNIPAMVGSGATALYADVHTQQAQKEIAESLMRSVGLAIWVEHEQQLNVVTALSGSGPAYFFLVMEALQQAAETLGLTHQQARLLTVQTALGAARLALETEQPITELRDSVTSKGGTTEQGVKVLQENNVPELFAKALQAAKYKAVEMSKSFIS